MTAKKWITRITFLISLISLPASIFTFFLYQWGYPCAELLYSIALAIFGSAMLGFIISLIEYFTEKRKTLDEVFDELARVSQKISTAKYFFTAEPTEMVKNCLREEWLNSYYQLTGSNVKDDAKKELISYFEENSNFSPKDIGSYDEMLQSWFEAKMKEYDEKISCSMSAYIEIAEIDLNSLKKAYKNLDFMFRSCELKKWLSDNVYKKIKKDRDVVKTDYAYHFKNYIAAKNGGNKSVMLDFLLELNERFFCVDADETQYVKKIKVYAKLKAEIDTKIEEYRCKVYGEKFAPLEMELVFASGHARPLINWTEKTE